MHILLPVVPIGPAFSVPSPSGTWGHGGGHG